jgi:pseudouridine-5'-phosphate glycosidase
MDKYLDINEEVKVALEKGVAVVALESTIISHGMPYPQNVETARNVEKIIRDMGAVPATICIMDGRIKVGITDDELETLGKASDVLKTSRRDLPIAVAKKMIGATTVSATMYAANLAGIRVFATGGIGGVHREAETTMDISADLTELSKTSVCVVCAGVKSILDIGLTLEYLETEGVPVITFDSNDFPAFYTRKSGFSSPNVSADPKEIAEILNAKWELGLEGGVVLANPIPTEFEMDYDVINKAIEDALKEMSELGIFGKESTPFLLGKIKDITGGDSLASNIELVYNNARVATKVALELAKL